MKRILLLYNNNAGRGTIARRLAAIEEEFVARDYGVRRCAICFGQNPLEGMTEEWIVVCGGDGTINYVVNCMCELGLDLPIGIIPTGTANDFATALGLSGGVRRVAAQLAEGHVERVDCGRVNGQYFINVLSLGIFTTTSQHTPDAVKHRFGNRILFFTRIKDGFCSKFTAVQYSVFMGKRQSFSCQTDNAGGR
jgi:diacylglycerol kinase family enzyme